MLVTFSAGAMIVTGGAAYAAEGVDLTVSVSDRTVAAGEPLARHRVTVRNTGTVEVPAGWRVEYDLGGLDERVVRRDGELARGCVEERGKIVCTVPEGLPVGRSLDLATPFTLTGVGAGPGPAGGFTVAAVAEEDGNPADNTATVDVEVPAVGVDLVSYAEDIRQVTADGGGTDRPVPPGGETILFGAVANVGDTVAEGVRVRVTLPEYVTFGEVEQGCDYTPDNRTVTCDYHQIVLVPTDRDTGGDDELVSAVGLYFPVRVDRDAPGPLVAEGGELYAAALDTTDGTSPARRRTPALPEGVRALSAEEAEDLAAKEVEDAEPGDNSYPFAAHIAGPPDGSGSGSGSGSGGGDGLPVTGVQAGLIGGVGAGVLLVGGVLIFLARRRRVVLVAPEDEKPNA
ncbi:LPXTG cell wall anchor domain-containing protein [Plantactinospora sp. B5E13]|uniref:LPXTG cell wall anchor domain-containing protein n=1 Tax=Plantactinospora sp. B5E13 TaxID=3153758 RepID=UPI00325D49C6